MAPQPSSERSFKAWSERFGIHRLHLAYDVFIPLGLSDPGEWWFPYARPGEGPPSPQEVLSACMARATILIQLHEASPFRSKPVLRGTGYGMDLWKLWCQERNDYDRVSFYHSNLAELN